MNGRIYALLVFSSMYYLSIGSEIDVFCYITGDIDDEGLLDGTVDDCERPNDQIRCDFQKGMERVLNYTLDNMECVELYFFTTRKDICRFQALNMDHMCDIEKSSKCIGIEILCQKQALEINWLGYLLLILSIVIVALLISLLIYRHQHKIRGSLDIRRPHSRGMTIEHITFQNVREYPRDIIGQMETRM